MKILVKGFKYLGNIFGITISLFDSKLSKEEKDLHDYFYNILKDNYNKTDLILSDIYFDYGNYQFNFKNNKWLVSEYRSTPFLVITKNAEKFYLKRKKFIKKSSEEFLQKEIEKTKIRVLANAIKYKNGNEKRKYL